MSDTKSILNALEQRASAYGDMRSSAITAIVMDRTAEKIRDLSDMLAALHYEALAIPRVNGSPFDMAMLRVEKEFGADEQFSRRFT